MTEYEVLELRHYYRTEDGSAFRYWVSLNFALLVAAYAVGTHLNAWIVLVLLLLYGMVTYANFRVRRSIHTDQQALFEQINQMINVGDTSSPALIAVAQSHENSRSFRVTAYVMRVILIISTVVFVLNRAGYIG
jgi:hypothetical protein